MKANIIPFSGKLVLSISLMVLLVGTVLVAPAGALGDQLVIDDFEDGDSSDWFFFGGNSVGGGGGVLDDRPQAGSYYLSTGWGGEGSSSFFYGGFFKNLDNTTQIVPPADPWFNVWVLNQSDATVDQYTLEITIREDLDGNGWTDGAEDSFRLDTVFTSAEFDDQWTLVSASVSSFTNLFTGGDGTFNGNLDEVVVVISGVEGASGSTVEVDFDTFSFTSGGPIGLIDNFENGLPSGFDANGIPIGFFTVTGSGTMAIDDQSTPPAPVLPTLGEPNHVLQTDVDTTSWAVVIHGFENEAVDTWVPQDWSAYEGFAFWFHGSNSGISLFIDLLENRNPGSTTDDAERWTVTFTDDFSGWQYIQFPFTAFVRKDVGNGAPNDGLTLDEVHGWAFGTLGTGGLQTFYLDQVSLYGVAPERPLEVTFSASEYKTGEGTTAQIEVKLTRPLKEGDPDQVSVDYTTDMGSAIVDRDYTPTAGTLVFEKGGLSKLTFLVETFDNSKHDGDKTVLLRLSDPIGVPIGIVIQSRLTILDNDPFDELLIDDFERDPDLFETYGGVSISRLEIPGGDPLALPDQGDYEGVLNVVAPLAVDISIMPGSDGDSICNSGKGVVPVAILTTETFDALTVDHTTVTLGDAYEAHVDNKTGVARRHEEDVDDDGDMDLVFHFVYAETGLGCDPAEAVLNGSTFDGQPITAGGDSSLFRDFPLGENWSAYEGLNFWYYGTGSGDTVELQLKDNRAPDADPSGWNLVWSDEFNDPAGTSPNPANWTHEIGDGTINGNPGWGNSELQYYTDSLANSATDGEGNLVITAREADGSLLCYYGPCEYTSARLISWYKAEFVYGRIESRLRVPEGAGLWPAFWTLGTDIGEVDWPQSGEIDIMEFVGREPYEVFGTIHGPGYSGGQSFGDTYTFDDPVFDDFHTFAIEWQPDLIEWYVDDILYHTAIPANVAPNEWAFNHPFFIILNVAVGGNFGGPVGEDTTFPQEMTIDYVQVYQGPDTAERWQASFVDDFTGWQQDYVPFSSFTRSAEQPQGAPDDGLNLTEVWGYGFGFPGGTSSGSVLLDQVRLPTLPDESGIIIDDFEAGLPQTWFQYGDYGAGTIIDTTTLVVTDRPGGVPDTSVLSIDYVSSGWGAGTGQDLNPPQDWSAADGLSFWYYGSNSGTTFELILSDNKSDPNADTAERFHAAFTDDFTGWQHISLPWSVFYRGAWQPPGAPDDGLTLTEMWAYAIALPTGTDGVFYIDDVALVK